jgi:HEPN domain-containing protein
MSAADDARDAVWRAWIRKSSNDFLCIENNVSASDVPWDAVAFHAQQAVEKLLKALLVRHGLVPPRTHDLVSILAICVEFVPSLSVFESECEQLTVRAVRSRYPDDREEITEADARKLVEGALRMRSAILPWMG